MTPAARAGLADSVWLALTLTTAAHRLDEYLQAARLDVARDRVDLEIDLTPGAAVAPAIIAGIDRDRDGSASPGETAAYVAGVVESVRLALDGRRLSLAVARSSMPSFGDMREGTGVIRVTAGARMAALVPGRHELRFRNNHQPERGVYLANALVPQDPAVSITAQHRDVQQRELQVDVMVDARGERPGPWMLFGPAASAAILAGVVWWYRYRASLRNVYTVSGLCDTPMPTFD